MSSSWQYMWWNFFWKSSLIFIATVFSPDLTKNIHAYSKICNTKLEKKIPWKRRQINKDKDALSERKQWMSFSWQYIEEERKSKRKEEKVPTHNGNKFYQKRASTGGPRISWFLAPNGYPLMRGPWILGTAFSIKTPK